MTAAMILASLHRTKWRGVGAMISYVERVNRAPLDYDAANDALNLLVHHGLTEQSGHKFWRTEAAERQYPEILEPNWDALNIVEERLHGLSKPPPQTLIDRRSFERINRLQNALTWLIIPAAIISLPFLLVWFLLRFIWKKLAPKSGASSE